MGKIQLEKEDKERDAAFNKAMHGKTAAQANSVATIFFKDPEAKQAALDGYFKHFDGKRAENETEADRKVRLCCAHGVHWPYGPYFEELTKIFRAGSDGRVCHSDKTVSFTT